MITQIQTFPQQPVGYDSAMILCNSQLTAACFKTALIRLNQLVYFVCGHRFLLNIGNLFMMGFDFCFNRIPCISTNLIKMPHKKLTDIFMVIFIFVPWENALN